MPLLNIVVGLLLLLFGRRLFWLFIAGLGFVVGARLASDVFAFEPQWMVLLTAISLGLAGLLLAVFLQGVVVAICGFLAGGYLLYTLTMEAHFDHDFIAWIAFFLGGFLGAKLVSIWIDWALIVLSAMTGAAVLCQSVPIPPLASPAVLVALVAIGIGTQARHLALEQSPPKPRNRSAARKRWNDAPSNPYV